MKTDESLDYPLIIHASLPEPCLKECCKTWPGTTVTVVGWGLTEHSFYSNELLQIKQSIMATSPVCEDAWENVTSRMFCVKVEIGIDSCHGK